MADNIASRFGPLYVSAYTAGLAEGRRKGLEEAAAKCTEKARDFLSPEYAVGQPLSSVYERFACKMCADGILALIKESTP